MSLMFYLYDHVILTKKHTVGQNDWYGKDKVCGSYIIQRQRVEEWLIHKHSHKPEETKSLCFHKRTNVHYPLNGKKEELNILLLKKKKKILQTSSKIILFLYVGSILTSEYY